MSVMRLWKIRAWRMAQLRREEAWERREKGESQNPVTAWREA